ncbi:basic proline-rich protein-like [Portunus trituberculatus]|uniref:basic proline-rich protein-like n=1 Tax=Portunus trituberculatus TaxID=210409 RepID=UPI001E1CF8D9|nr:basic proline-rich protein-like [Portunus trituberculatus]
MANSMAMAGMGGGAMAGSGGGGAGGAAPGGHGYVNPSNNAALGSSRPRPAPPRPAPAAVRAPQASPRRPGRKSLAAATLPAATPAPRRYRAGQAAPACLPAVFWPTPPLLATGHRWRGRGLSSLYFCSGSPSDSFGNGGAAPLNTDGTQAWRVPEPGRGEPRCRHRRHRELGCLARHGVAARPAQGRGAPVVVAGGDEPDSGRKTPHTGVKRYIPPAPPPHTRQPQPQPPPEPPQPPPPPPIVVLSLGQRGGGGAARRAPPPPIFCINVPYHSVY